MTKEIKWKAIAAQELFVCPFHECLTDNGWCWECAVETYGYEEAKRIHEDSKKGENNWKS